MIELTALERAVLYKIVSQYPEASGVLSAQLSGLSVTGRENTGAGFYTRFAIDSQAPVASLASPIGDVAVKVDGLDHGIGFLLWLRDGYMNQLEGFSFEEDTSDIDWTNPSFNIEHSALY